MSDTSTIELIRDIAFSEMVFRQAQILADVPTREPVPNRDAR
jgi:hypothetical protein